MTSVIATTRRRLGLPNNISDEENARLYMEVQQEVHDTYLHQLVSSPPPHVGQRASLGNGAVDVSLPLSRELLPPADECTAQFLPGLEESSIEVSQSAISNISESSGTASPFTWSGSSSEASKSYPCELPSNRGNPDSSTDVTVWFEQESCQRPSDALPAQWMTYDVDDPWSQIFRV
jgi:hypothetical protein